MAAMYRFNSASFGILPNKNPANAILFDVKVGFVRLIGEMTRNKSFEALDWEYSLTACPPQNLAFADGSYMLEVCIEREAQLISTTSEYFGRQESSARSILEATTPKKMLRK